MSKKHDSELPPPVTRKSSKADLWSEIEAMQDEIDSQQSALNAARDAAMAKDAELAAMRAKLASAYLRLNVIQAALSQPEAA
jgi:hypothetical protein